MAETLRIPLGIDERLGGSGLLSPGAPCFIDGVVGRLRLGDRLFDPKITFLDCDGVIFDVNEGKSRAFRTALAGFPSAAVEAFMAHHQDFGGVSRYEKLRRFFTETHPVDDPNLHIDQTLERFGRASRAAYRSLVPRVEAKEFAQRLAPAHVVSGADQVELRGIFSDKELTSVFPSVWGSPTPKRDHMARLLTEAGVAATEAIMVGDGKGDWLAAQSLGVPFIFLAQMSEWATAQMELQGQTNVWWVADWAKLLDGVLD